MSDLLFDSLGDFWRSTKCMVTKTHLSTHGQNPRTQTTGKIFAQSVKKDIKLTLANSETDLMAHHVWEAAIQMSICCAWKDTSQGQVRDRNGCWRCIPAIVRLLVQSLLATDHSSLL